MLCSRNCRCSASNVASQAPAYTAIQDGQAFHRHAGTQTAPSMYVGVQTTPAANTSPLNPATWNLSHVVGVLLSATLALVGISIIYLARALRPFLKAAERAMREMEKAAEEMQDCADEMEKMAEMLQADMPPALEAMEDSAREVEELSESMKVLIGPLTNVNVGPAIKRKRELRAYKARMMLAAESSGEDAKPPEALTKAASEEKVDTETERSPIDFFPSWGKVDVTVLTKAMTPFLDNWRVRVKALSSEIQRKSTSATQAIASSPTALISGLVQASAAADAMTADASSAVPAGEVANEVKWRVPPPHIALQQWGEQESDRVLPDASRVTVDISVDKAPGSEAATRLRVSASKTASTSNRSAGERAPGPHDPWTNAVSNAARAIRVGSAVPPATKTLLDIEPHAVSETDRMNAAWAAMGTGRPLHAHVPRFDFSSEIVSDNQASRDGFDDDDHDDYYDDDDHDEKGVMISVRAFNANGRSSTADDLWRQPSRSAAYDSTESLPSRNGDARDPAPFPPALPDRPSGGARRSPAMSVAQATADAATVVEGQSMVAALHTGHRGVIDGVMSSLRVAKNALDIRLGFVLMLLMSVLMDRTAS